MTSTRPVSRFKFIEYVQRARMLVMEAKDYIILIVPTSIAFLGWLIALNQYRLSYHKVRLDLFERRMRIFDCTMAYLEGVRLPPQNVYLEARNFLGDIGEARFLFSEDIYEHLLRIREHFLEIKRLAGEREDIIPSTEDRKKRLLEINRDINERRQWLADQLLTDAHIVFQPYLGFQNIRQRSIIGWIKETWIEARTSYAGFRAEQGINRVIGRPNVHPVFPPADRPSNVSGLVERKKCTYTLLRR